MISKNIKILRERYNLSQKELAVIAGVSDKAVSSWERGTKEPRMGAIQKLAEHFNLLSNTQYTDLYIFTKWLSYLLLSAVIFFSNLYFYLFLKNFFDEFLTINKKRRPSGRPFFVY